PSENGGGSPPADIDCLLTNVTRTKPHVVLGSRSNILRISSGVTSSVTGIPLRSSVPWREVILVMWRHHQEHGGGRQHPIFALTPFHLPFFPNAYCSDRSRSVRRGRTAWPDNSIACCAT